ncbi:heat shock 70 kDa protein 13-like [Senna tora]|uniref:Heat shock 70 kDa protein 13-like n=1 Tax=Senna tora TaxID=362788 RepID=A0A834T0K8_9FABA|nr:heat shock 70 kDa protein 13-like [Senna tora]
MNENSPYLKLIFTFGKIHLGGEDFIDRLIDLMVGEDLFKVCLERVNEFFNEVDLEGADVNHLILAGGSWHIPRLRHIILPHL